MTTEVKFLAGTHIEQAAEQLVAIANKDGSAWGFFNDVKLAAMRGASPADVVSDFTAEVKHQSDAYEKSEAGKQAAKNREERRSSAQAKHDALMAELTKLDFSNDAKVLDWVCRMQEPSDHAGVIVRTDTIVSAFESRGFVANANCGPDFKADDRDNSFRYLIGQALSGLSEGPAIHPIIHKFADQWRARWLPGEA